MSWVSKSVLALGWPQPPDTNPIAYLGRWPGEDYDAEAGRPRYKFPESSQANRIVYGLRQALEHSFDDAPLIVVEGPFKVYHLVAAAVPIGSQEVALTLVDM